MRYRYRSHASRAAAAERRAQAERDAGIPDRTDADCRQPIALDLSSVGGRCLTLEPRRGYVSYRARDIGTGEVVACAALKTLLHKIADDLPRMLGRRS
jgi:hypothetical protein